MPTIQDYYRDRLYNCKNSHQGTTPKILCVCSAGLLRSATLASVLANPPYKCNTRNCGTHEEFALIQLDQVLIEWADHIIFVNKENYDLAKDKFQFAGMDGGVKHVHVLDIPDSYGYCNPKLVKIIKKLLKECGLHDILAKKPTVKTKTK